MTHKCNQQIQNVCIVVHDIVGLYESVRQRRGFMEPIILVTEANILCVKITVNAKWVMTRISTMTQSR